MNLVGLMVVRNSDWCIGLTLRALLQWCDSVVVLMHNCRDETSDIVSQVNRETKRVAALVDSAADWEEMRMRQTMLEMGRELLNATHFAIVDDDEILTGNLLDFPGPGRKSKIREHVEQTPVGSIVMLPWLQLRPGFQGGWGGRVGSAELGVMSSGMWASQMASTAFRDDAFYYWAAKDGYDLHHRQPYGRVELAWHCPIGDRSAGLMHLQFASRRRLLAKQFLYQLVEQKRWPGRRSSSDVREYYARTVHESDSAVLAPVPASWWASYSDLMKYFELDKTPWQEGECRRMIEENPRLADGLDDFGLLKEWGIQ
jgi:hypothetical protein